MDKLFQQFQIQIKNSNLIKLDSFPLTLYGLKLSLLSFLDDVGNP